MKIGLGDVMKAVDAAGAVNPTARKISREHNFFKDSIISIILFVFGVFFLFLVWYVGSILILISVLAFFTSKKTRKRFKLISKMREDLRSSPSLDENVSKFFVDVKTGHGKDKQGYVEDRENVLILTDKRLIFMYIPRVGIEDLTSGNIVGTIGQAVSYDGLKKKVEDEIQKKGVRQMIRENSSYSMSYDEINKVKISKFTSRITFVYRGFRFKYFIRRSDIDSFRQVFANYIKV